MNNKLLINCDLGEWETPSLTASLMAHIHLANIACGGHAGNETTIKKCHELAQLHQVETGAHPGLIKDKGRTLPSKFTIQDFKDLLERQLETYLKTNTPLHHIKLHGALYHLAETNPEIQQTYLQIVKQYQTKTLCLSKGNLSKICTKNNIPYISEAFLDRNYLTNGQLVPRTEPNAYLTNLTKIQQRIHSYKKQNRILTLCIHSDTHNSLDIAKTAAQILKI